MIRTPYPGGSYIDALPSGEFVVLYIGSHLQTHLGRVALPPGETFGLMFLHCSNVGGFHFAGLQQHGGGLLEWRDGQYRSVPMASGRAVYDLQGVLRDTLPAGYQYCDEQTGALISRIDAYPANHGVNEWRALPGGLVIGQANDAIAPPEIGGMLVWDGTVHRLVEPGFVIFINGHVADDREHVTLAFATRDSAVVIETTLDELRSLPIFHPSESPPDPEPPDPEPVPLPPRPPDPPPPPPIPKEPPVTNQNRNPSYDEFIVGPQSEAMQVWAAYLATTHHDPAIPDYFHWAWRRLRERWTLRDILHDIKGEALEDGGAGGADSFR